jgi:hypothetical protein
MNRTQFKESECEKMTYVLQDFQNLAQGQGKEQIEKLFEQYKKEMLYLGF